MSIDPVDQYLEAWDAFAQGDNSLVPVLNEDFPRFSAALAGLLGSGDPRAPARAVFFALVQVGGFIPVESEIGAALAPVLGPAFPVTETEDSPPSYFAGDLYFWWLENDSGFQAYELLDEWLTREFARTTVIPMYQAVRQNPNA